MSIQHGDNDAFLEKATFKFQGREFTYTGSHLVTGKDGKLHGIFYAYDETLPYQVGTCDGTQKVPAFYGRTWRNNMGDERQSVYFIWEGHYMYGVYMMSGSSIIRCREIEKKNFPTWLQMFQD